MMLQTAARGNARLGLPSFSEFRTNLLSAKHSSKALPVGIRDTLLTMGNDDDVSSSSSSSYYIDSDEKKNFHRIGAMTKCVNTFIEEQMKKKSGGTSDAVYTPETLDVYDTIVWDFNSPFHWRIEREEIDALYQLGLKGSRRHCEVAAGTGLLLREWAKNQERLRKATAKDDDDASDNNQKDTVTSLDHLALMDLSLSSLDGSHSRMQEEEYFRCISMEMIQADILKPPCKNLMGTFDSVAANFLLHCLHGESLYDKRDAIQSCASLLKADGVFFGSTILGKDMHSNPSAAGPHALATNDLYNKLGVFGNRGDTFVDMASILDDLFHHVIIFQTGYCAVWLAHFPKP